MTELSARRPALPAMPDGSQPSTPQEWAAAVGEWWADASDEDRLAILETSYHQHRARKDGERAGT
ncbi:hypothetical protein [Amycolatopsis keratiniphila]|uniref:Uncharacterized protein n=1 Tax=Amycolatopsis keratiniphila subsp. keratiniphila TaxID=227715 RepID=A0A1W2M246_9PSEU|nr:hypothetical protein [Amycolatopsis keratiniphila]ONF73956.1 hypothetical protein AVR91_0204295 [Amycolatopsis keratiniphila subsp. keratiniphila]